MTRSSLMRLLALLAAFGLVAAACGSDDDDTGDDTETTESEDGGEDTEDGDTEDGDDEEAAAGSLADVCPSPLVVQTDWFPESEHGAMYEMIGEGYTVDVEQKIVRGPMVSEGQDLGIEWEVRTGGPAIGFQPTATVVYTDDSIHLAYQNTESQVLAFGDTPMISVVAPLEKNPQMIMWDPATYPDIDGLAGLGEENVTINVFGGGVFSEVFVAMGLWTEDQIDPSYDGSPARFIAEGGAIAQQGFASAEPHNYENVFEEWGKPVAYELLHDAGFEVYSQTIAVRPDTKDELNPCLEQVVPIIQKAVVSYNADPARANAIIIDAVEQYADSWVYDEALADFSVQTQRELGLIGNGPDSTVGNMDEARVQGVIDLMADSGLDTSDISAADIMTNEFIDESIGFATDDTADSTTTTVEEETTTTTTSSGSTVSLSGVPGVDGTFVVESCSSADESSVTLRAQTQDLEEPVIMEVEASGGSGTIVLSGAATEFEGTVDSVTVGDTGELSASGVITAADDSAEPNPFELTGTCAS